MKPTSSCLQRPKVWLSPAQELVVPGTSIPEPLVCTGSSPDGETQVETAFAGWMTARVCPGTMPFRSPLGESQGGRAKQGSAMKSGKNRPLCVLLGPSQQEGISRCRYYLDSCRVRLDRGCLGVNRTGVTQGFGVSMGILNMVLSQQKHQGMLDIEKPGHEAPQPWTQASR